jgi:hypothetical protein
VSTANLRLAIDVSKKIVAGSGEKVAIMLPDEAEVERGNQEANIFNH